MKTPESESAPEYGGLFEGNSWRLPSDVGLVEKAEEMLKQRLEKTGPMDEEDVYKICMVFREALINAIAHGNLGLESPKEEGAVLKELAAQKFEEIKKSEQPEKYVAVDFDIMPGKEIKIVIKDEGAGFNWRALPDPQADENLLMTSGRGILLARSFFDSIDFNEKGNEITMVKKFGPASENNTRS